MRKIKFVDQTIRDAQQSLWAYLMTSDMLMPIAPVMDKVGFEEIATIGSQGIVIQVRNLHEDPWERIRRLSNVITHTPLRGSYMTASLASFDVDTPRDAIALWIKRMAANGIKSFWVCDYQTDMERFYYFAKLVKEEGGRVIPALMYTFSPVHNEAHWAQKTRLIVEVKDCVDAIMIEDAGGVINPERTRELITAVKQNCDGIPIEFHSHCGVGLAPLCYLEAIQAGADTLHTAVAPLANGTSLPAIENILRNTRHLGYTDDIDDTALETMSNHFREIAEREGFPIGIPQEYDVFHFEHQIPGGMLTNLKRQLGEMKLEHRIDEILKEAVRVRKDFGYPVMATPFSQIVGAQAVENVILGERYKRILDQSIKYIGGHYGEPPGPINPDLMDRIGKMSEAKAILNWKPVNRFKPLAQLREEVGSDLTDDEFLLKLLIPGFDPKKQADTTTASQASGKDVIRSASAKRTLIQPAAGFPMEFCVDVDGEEFNVKISSIGDTGNDSIGEDRTETGSPGNKEALPGAVGPKMAGMLVSIKVTPGQVVNEGDLLATIEAMKMLRDVNAPHSGIVKEIFFKEGESLEADDILMIVEPNNE